VLSLPPAVRIFVATQPTSMHLSFDRLAALAREVLRQDPFSGHLFVYRNRRGDMVKILYWDGQGFCLFAKRLERGRFLSYDHCQPPRTQLAVRCRLASALSSVEVRMGQSAGITRRSLRLLFGGWVPHDDGASEVCLALATDVSLSARPTRIRGFPLPHSTPWPMRTASYSKPSGSLDLLPDCPHEAEQLARDHSGCHD